jgi:hypothetical protein
MSVAWALVGGSSPTPGAVTEWFAKRYADARAALPAADFDTIIGEEFAETITSEWVDTIGPTDANAVDTETGGVVEVVVGDAITAPSTGRLQLTGSGSHVRLLSGNNWYMAALAKYIAPLDVTQLGDTSADLIALWGDDDNRVSLGVLASSGGSVTNWVGRVRNDAGDFTTLGPALDPVEGPVWHLFEVWSNGVDTVNFRIDGVAFAGTIDGANLPAIAARLGMTIARSAVGDPAAVWWDKACVVVRSPRVGEP